MMSSHWTVGQLVHDSNENFWKSTKVVKKWTLFEAGIRTVGLWNVSVKRSLGIWWAVVGSCDPGSPLQQLLAGVIFVNDDFQKAQPADNQDRLQIALWLKHANYCCSRGRTGCWREHLLQQQQTHCATWTSMRTMQCSSREAHLSSCSVSAA